MGLIHCSEMIEGENTTFVLNKTRKFQYTNRVNLSVFTVHLAEILQTHLYSHLPYS